MGSVNFLLDTRSKNKNGLHPVKLNVYHAGEQRAYSTGYFFDQPTWNNLSSSRKEKDKFAVKKLDEKKKKAEDVLDEISGKGFSWKKFKNRFYSDVTETKIYAGDSIKAIYTNAIAELNQHKQFKTAENYQCSMKSLLKFGGDDLTIQEIDLAWLNDYRTWLYDQDLSSTTLSCYIRPLKKLFNEAVFDETVLIQNSPFHVKKAFQAGSSESADAALTPEQMSEWQQYKPKTKAQHYIKSLWWFSYFCNGIGWTDLCYLKKKNRNGEFIEYFRRKPRNTSKKPKLSRALINPVMEDVMNEFGAKKGSYMFPILDESMSEIEKYATIKKKQTQMNRRLAGISKSIGFRIPFGSARHSHATALNEMGAPLSHIQDSLGHSRITTTENYISRIKPAKIKECASMLDKYIMPSKKLKVV